MGEPLFPSLDKANRTCLLVPGHIQDVKLRGLGHLGRDPRQPVVAHTEHSEAAAPTDLQQEGKHNLLQGLVWFVFLFLGNDDGPVYQMA